MDGESVLRPGFRLDRFELLCPVASGGMAAVWLARLRGKRDFEKLFAIKTIKTELGDDTRFQEMFLDEARIASGIEHPNVAHILDLGEQDGILYIVMEWVDGEALAKVARQARKVDSPLPLDLALRIVADACAGLHAAHELKDRAGQTLGVVHRDISPQNILIADNGGVKVIDFGVAKARNRRAGETGAGVVKGKIRFMAPEQVRSQPLDRRADIWAMGVVLCELATGRLPFDDDSDVDVVRRLLSDEPPPGFDDVPPQVGELLAHSLVRDPSERFATASAMRRAVETAMTQLKLHATSEDVADFVRTHLPEFAEKRHKIVSKAMEDADSRLGQSGPTSLASAEEVFAPTMIEERITRPDPKPSSPKLQVTSARAILTGRDESGIGAFTDEEVAAAGLPKRRGALWLIAFASLAAVAWFVWPGSMRIRSFVRPSSAAPSPSPSPSPSLTPPPSLTPSLTPPPPPSLTPSSSAAASVAPSATVPPPPPTSTIRRNGNDVTFTPGPFGGNATPTTTAVPTATAQPTPTQTAAPPPEEANPY